MRAFQGVEWTIDDIATYATTLTSYAASGSRLYGGVTQRHLDPAAVQDTLFPGVAVLVLGIAGLASAPRRYRSVAIAASVLAIVVSLGPQTAFYRFLHEHVVLVRGVRALSRFSLVPVLALSVLAGLASPAGAVSRCRRWRWSCSSPRTRRSATIAGRAPRRRRARSPAAAAPSSTSRWVQGTPRPCSTRPRTGARW
jgi:hypothetical protein